MLKPYLMNETWYIQANAKTVGWCLLLEKDSSLPIPLSFQSQEKAQEHIDRLLKETDIANLLITE